MRRRNWPPAAGSILTAVDPNDVDTDIDEPSSPSSTLSFSSDRGTDRDRRVNHNVVDRDIELASEPSRHSPTNTDSDNDVNIDADDYDRQSPSLRLVAPTERVESDSEPPVLDGVDDNTVFALPSSAATDFCAGTNTDSLYEYRIEHFPHCISTRQERLTSGIFTQDGLNWQLLFFPSGNPGARYPSFHSVDTSISLFVQLLPHQTLPYNTKHSFKFTVVPPPGSALQPVFKESSHKFTLYENDRGFNDLASLGTVQQYLHPPNQTLVIAVELKRLQSQPSPLFTGSWNADYDSKATTGFVGLKNQGATCYMNSLLQTLFHLPMFRALTYSMNTEGETPPPVPLSLQRVFYQLQTSLLSPSTKPLTQAFGWNSLESFMQHDVQEFSRVLLDNLDERMKASEQEGCIDKLFAGKVEMYVECVNVPYSSQRVETYLDLAMNVKNCPTLEQSFHQYCEVEMLDGDNKYRAENFGLQDARKGVRFLSFPPVLQLQLKRFEYNFERDMNVKVNDRFEFPLTIDLSQYLSPNAEPFDVHDRPVYELHSVLVHSGSGHGGHYYSYIRPFFLSLLYRHSPWFKFDDELVTKATEEEATVGNYGGEIKGSHYFPLTGRMSIANAYMLVYVRRSVTQAITQPAAPVLSLLAKNELMSDAEEAEVKHSTDTHTRTRTVTNTDNSGEEKKELSVLTESKEVTETNTEMTDSHVPDLSPPSIPSHHLDTMASDPGVDEKLIEAVVDTLPADDKENITETGTDIDITQLKSVDVPLPPALLARFQREEEENRERKERAARAHLYTELKLISEAKLIEESLSPLSLGMGTELTIAKQETNTTTDNDSELSITDMQIVYSTPETSVRVLKSHTVAEAATEKPSIKVNLSTVPLSLPHTGSDDGSNRESQQSEWELNTGIPRAHQQYLRMYQRQNETTRPNSVILPTNHHSIETLRLERVYVRDHSIDVDGAILWLTGESGVGYSEHSLDKDNGDRCIVLIKYLDLAQQKFFFLGSIMIKKSLTIKQLKEVLPALMWKRGLAVKRMPEDLDHYVDNDEAVLASAPASSVSGSTNVDDETNDAQSPDIPMTEEKDEAKQDSVIEYTAHSNWPNDDDSDDYSDDGNTVMNGTVRSAEPELLVWEEEAVHNNKIVFLSDDALIGASCRLRNGDLLCFQFRYSNAELGQLSQYYRKKYSVRCPNPYHFSFLVPQHLVYLRDRILIEFRPVPVKAQQHATGADAGVVKRLEMLRTSTLGSVTSVLAESLRVDAGKLSLYRPNAANKAYAESQSLLEQFRYKQDPCFIDLFVDTTEPILYYSIDEFSQAQLKENYLFSVCYCCASSGWERSVKVLVPKIGSGSDVIAATRKRIAELYSDEPLVFTEPTEVTLFTDSTLKGLTPHFLSPSGSTEDLYNACVMQSVYPRRVQELVIEEWDEAIKQVNNRETTDTDTNTDTGNGSATTLQLMIVFRYHPAPPGIQYRTYSHPFTVCLARTDTPAQALARIADRLRITDQERRANLRLAWLVDYSGRELDLGSDLPLERLKENTRMRLALHDPHHYKQHVTALAPGLNGSAHDLGMRNAPFPFGRTNNSAVKIYSQS